MRAMTLVAGLMGICALGACADEEGRGAPDGAEEGASRSALRGSSTELVVFRADKDVADHFELYRVNVDGTNLLKLSPPVRETRDVMAGSARISPDGRYVAFTVDGDRIPRPLYVAETDGGAVVEISGYAPEVDAFATSEDTWSPDGNRLMFPTEDGALWTVRPDGTDLVRVSPAVVAGGFLGLAHWSPDGLHIAYLAEQNELDVSEAFVTDADGLNDRQLNLPLVPGGSVVGLAWSPRNDQVAYLADQDVNDRMELYGAMTDTGVVMRLSGPMTGALGVGDFAWSRDGRRIVYKSAQRHPSVRELFSSAHDGTDIVRLSRDIIVGTEYIGGFTGPMGGGVYYELGSLSGENTLEYVELDGTSKRRVFTAPSSSAYFREWVSPDGETVALYVADAGDESIVVVDMNGIARVALEAGSALSVTNSPLWDPRGESLVFDAHFDAGGGVTDHALLSYLVDADTTITIGGPTYDYAFTSSGSRVVYQEAYDAPGVKLDLLFTTAPDGSIPALDIVGTVAAGGSVHHDFRVH